MTLEDPGVPGARDGLTTAANEVVADLLTIHRRLDHGRVMNMQHEEFAERALSLGLYLRSAIELTYTSQYLAAYAVLRAALEHHLTDRLVFLARRYTRRYLNVSRADYERLATEHKAGKGGTEDIVRIAWRDGTLDVVRTGIHQTHGRKGPRAPTLSLYYFLLDEFDPFVGRPEEQAHLAREFTETELRIQRAQEQQSIYRLLRWNELKNNLAENRLASVEDLRRFEVHYRFLSAFVHPVPTGYNLVYGHNRPTHAPKYDHYAAELALLYVSKLAGEELKRFKRMSTRTPSVGLTAWDEVDRRVQSADLHAGHLWFPGDQPHTYDYVAEANSRGMRKGRLVPRDRRPRPDQLRPRQVRYYRNPLERLVRLHESFNELTGFSYQSPWPRADTRFR